MGVLSLKSGENEVSVDWFFKLKEIDSLTKMRINYLKAKSEQEDRVSGLNKKRQERQNQGDALQQEKFSVHHELAELDKKLKNATEQRQRLKDIGGDEKKILAFTETINECEERGMELLTREEEIDSELGDVKTFLAGIDKTIKEFEEEFAPETQKILQEVANADLRMKLLIDELPSDFRGAYDRTVAKKLAHGPFTRIEQGSCFFCRAKISRQDESEIDMQKILKTCPQCSRIFLPYGA